MKHSKLTKVSGFLLLALWIVTCSPKYNYSLENCVNKTNPAPVGLEKCKKFFAQVNEFDTGFQKFRAYSPEQIICPNGVQHYQVCEVKPNSSQQ